jgi:DNA-directed RNA polymerase subunit K
MEQEFTKYERARIIGARALQVAMNAPLLIKISEEDLEKINFDAIKIAEVELDSGALPISIKKPFPKNVGGALQKPKSAMLSDAQKEASAEDLEKEIAEDGEIMALANPEEEREEVEGPAEV